MSVNPGLYRYFSRELNEDADDTLSKPIKEKLIC